MALQVVVKLEDIRRREKGGALTLKLKLFAEGDDVDTDDPVFEVSASADIKAKADDKTRQQLVNDATTKAGEELRAAALDYQRVMEYQSMVNTGAVSTAIEQALVG